MYDVVRDSTVGQFVRLVWPDRLSHPEERGDFKLPIAYTEPGKESDKPEESGNTHVNDKNRPGTPSGKEDPDIEANSLALRPFKSRTSCHTQPPVKEPGHDTIVPVRTKEGIVLVTWYANNDPANPQQWSSRKKLFVSAQIGVYTFAVYMGSSLYVASEQDVITKFHVSEVAAALGLALYVLAYGIGPMLWSPLSEIPVIGRMPIYIATYTVFVALCVAISLVDNFAGLLVLRFLLGFFGSPCLATGGASFGDMYAPSKMPYAIAIWAGAATLGPAFGPVVSGFAVAAEGWRWSSWELLWLSGPTLLLLLFCLPETSHDAILLSRARRLRRRTGRIGLQSQSEIESGKTTPKKVAFEALIKPWEINILDPAVLFTTAYTALVYGIFYSFFESFQLVYPIMYHFNIGQTSLPFLVVLVSLAICIPAYCAYFYYHAEPIMLASPDFGPPEHRLVPGLFAAFLIPIGCFMFAWAARPSVHWIVTVIGVGLNLCGTYIIVQCMFLYLPFTYPKYSASLFAANDLARSSFAAGAILFSRSMFLKLTVAGGVSLLGGLTVVCIAGVFVLYWYGAALRARSKFAVS